MLNSAALVAFVATASPEVARHFYVKLLGLPLVEDGPHGLLLNANGSLLHIQKVQQPVSAPYVVLGWQVSDLRNTVATLIERGVAFQRYDGLPQDDLGIWHAPAGARVAWFRDPDGNIVSLTELAR